MFDPDFAAAAAISVARQQALIEAQTGAPAPGAPKTLDRGEPRQSMAKALAIAEAEAKKLGVSHESLERARMWVAQHSSQQSLVVAIARLLEVSTNEND